MADADRAAAAAAVDGGGGGVPRPPRQQHHPPQAEGAEDGNNGANQNQQPQPPNNNADQQQQQQQQQPRQIDDDDGSEDDDGSRGGGGGGGGGGASDNEDEDGNNSDNEDNDGNDDDDDNDDNDGNDANAAAAARGAAGGEDLAEMDDNDVNDDDDDDGVLDGGVAGPAVVSAGEGAMRTRTKSTDCDVVLLIETSESLSSLAPDNPTISRRGTAVSIGLDKSTKLMVVFARYCDFINSQPLTPLPSFAKPSPTKGQIMSQQRHNQVNPEDLEFAHVGLLDKKDTAEASALMKNDKIYVRRRRADDRAKEDERRRVQREADRDYFRRMRHLLPDFSSGASSDEATRSPAPCDVVFYCTGRLVDGDGYKQEVLTPVVRAHSVVVSKRCKYLNRIIATARDEMASGERRDRDDRGDRAGMVRVPVPNEEGDDDGDGAAVVRPLFALAVGNANANGAAAAGGGNGNNNANDDAQPPRAPLVAGSPREVQPRDDDDDGIRGLPYPAGRRGDGEVRPIASDNNNVAEVEVDYIDEASNHSNNNNNHLQLINQQLIPQESADASEQQQLLAAAGAGAGALAAPSSSASGPAGSGSGNASNNSSNIMSESQSASNSTGLWIGLDHPPEAVRILLEYCYTNRVVSLGCQAFDKASRKPDTNPATAAASTTKKKSDLCPPVSPHSSRSWPNGGAPTVSLPVALAGIALAEEASLPRLSLMCEVAASELVTSATVLEALALCQSQSQRTGNKLVILRKAAMLNHVFVRGHRGVSDLVKMPSFQRSLQDKQDLVVPSLLMGTMEAVKATLGDHPDVGGSGGGGGHRGGAHHGHGGHGHGHHHHHSGGHGGRGRKRDANEISRLHYKQIDDVDAAEREQERRKRRLERWKKRRRIGEGGTVAAAAAAAPGGGGDQEHDDVTDPYNLQRWNDEAQNHMDLQIALIGEGVDMGPSTRAAVHRIFASSSGRSRFASAAAADASASGGGGDLTGSAGGGAAAAGFSNRRGNRGGSGGSGGGGGGAPGRDRSSSGRRRRGSNHSHGGSGSSS